MKILYICDRLPTFILNEIIQLQCRGHEVFILAGNSSRMYKAVHEPIVKKNGLDKHFFGFFIGTTRKQKYAQFFKGLAHDAFVYPSCATKACWHLLHNHPNLKCGVGDYLDMRNFMNSGIEVIHAPFSAPRIIDKVSLLSSMLDVPFTLCFRAHDIYHRNNMHEVTKRIAVIKKAAQIVTIAVYNRDNLYEKLAVDKNIKIIHSAIDLGLFHAKEESQSPHSIMAVSRLDDQKGIMYLVQACHILHTRGIKYECTIIGEGPEKKACQEFIAEQRIPNMRLIDYLPNEVVKEHLRQATVFVLPCEIAPDGKRDVLANALKEAMAMQVPVITSNVCGIEELVDDGINGILVPPQNPEAIADAIQKIMHHPEQRKAMGKAAREKIEKCFNIQTEVQKLEEIFSMAVMPDASPQRRSS